MALKLVESGGTDGYPDYPFASDLRLPTHHFFTFEHRRWLNSRLRLLAEPEVRAFAIDLYAICQDQTPVGTLPDDNRQLARLLHIATDRFEALLRFDITPLYGWYRCNVGYEVRLTHDVVLETISAALNRQKVAKDRSEAGNRRKRLNRLTAQIQAQGGPSGMYGNPAIVEWIDEWLEQACPGNRTAAWVQKAMEAYSTRDF